MFNIPSFKLKGVNVFNFRDHEWNEETIIEKVSSMLSCGEAFGIRVKTISIADKKNKKQMSELKKTRCKTLTIVLTFDKSDESDDLILEYDIPWLINNHFYVGGNYKIAIYQLYDKPVIKRPDLIRLRTNIQSFMLTHKTSKRKKYNYVVSVFGKKFAFARLVISFYGLDELKKVFKLNDNYEYKGRKKLSQPMIELYEDITRIMSDMTIDKSKLLENIFIRRTDEKILSNLKMIKDIDIFNNKYFVKDSIVEELIYALDNDPYDDRSYEHKRVRFAEQIICTHLCTDFYNLFNSVQKNRKAKFSINSKAILSGVTRSTIVQFDNSLNPLSELSMLSRMSLSGPGGFEKQNVPHELRDIHPSMQYLVDPADTADRDGCGTTQYLIPNVNIADDGSFSSEDKQCLNGVAISFVPFLEHDDATRLQMASSQQRHAIMLKKFDNAMVQSGIEGMYSNQTTFLFQAKRPGRIIYMDHEIILAQYDNKTYEAFYIGYKKLYISTVDFYHIYYNVGDEFAKNDIIAESNYMKNGRITLGRNCLTTLTPWRGYNFEDGIVISQKMVDEDYFTSVHYKDIILELGTNEVLMNLNNDYGEYKPLPNIGDTVERGEVFIKRKTIDIDGYTDTAFQPVSEEMAPEKYKIANIKIYANKWNKYFPQYDDYITGLVKSQDDRKEDLTDTLSKHLTKDELERMIDTLEINQMEKNNYKLKGDYIDGLRIEITVVYERKIAVGDKIGNRHGNKGIIAKIVPNDQMPRLEDGRHADIVINPLGVPSRMNIGQIFETHLTMSFNDLKIKIRDMYTSGNKDDIYSYVIEYIKLIDRTDDHNYTAQVVELFANIPIDNFVKDLDNFFLIQPPFQSIKPEDLDAILDYTGTPYEYDMLEPITGEHFKKTLNTGFMYWFKLNHIAKDKLAARGVGPYSAKTSQPLGGKSRKGGQRLGEMEVWAIIAHGDEKNLSEFMTTKSDSVEKRNKYISNQMCNSELLSDVDDDPVPQSLRLLQANLMTLGLNYELNEGFDKPTIDVEEIESEINGEERVILGEDSSGETVELSSGFTIGGGDWGGDKIKYHVSDPDAIPDILDELDDTDERIDDNGAD